MINAPKTIEEAKGYRYGRWGGKPSGHHFVANRCAYEVFPSGRGMIHHQCTRKPGHGPSGLYCKQHANQIGE